MHSPSRSAFHFRDYTQEMKKKSVVEKRSSRDEEGAGGRGERVRRGSEDEEEEGGVPVSVSSWMADHSRECHGGVISTNPMMDYEFEVTGTFFKPLHRQVDEYLRISRAESEGKIRVGKKVWKVNLPLLNRKHEYWAPRNMSYNFSNFNR